MKKIYSLLILLAFAYNAGAQTIYYVNIGTGNDANSGTSWGNSFQNLTRALAAANASSDTIVQVWVAEGAYTPIDGVSTLPSDHRDTSFTFCRGSGVRRSLKVYGGFVGSESSITARTGTHVSYLDGIIGSVNSFHVGVIVGLSPAADSVVLDGFTINNGYAYGAGTKVFNGVTIDHNKGGGLVIVNDSTAKVAVRNCQFSFNYACGQLVTSSTLGGSAYGGGMYLYLSSCLIDRCGFVGNYANGNNGGPSASSSGIGGNGYGGAIYNDSSAITILTCQFNTNLAQGGAGGPSGPYGYGISGNGYGGAIFFTRTNNASIRNSNFATNRTVIGPGDNLYSNIAYAQGAAVMHSRSKVRYVNCFFSKNICADSNCFGTENRMGGAVADVYSTIKYDTCSFMSNSVYAYRRDNNFGGAVYGYSSNDTFRQCTIDSNIAMYGQAIYNERSNAYFDGCRVRKNTMNVYGGPTNMPCIWGRVNSNVVINNSVIRNNYGGIVNDTSSLYLSNDTLDGQSYSSALSSTRSIATVTRSYFGNNGLGINNIATVLNVQLSTFSSNSPGIYTTGSVPFVDSCLFTNNNEYSSSGGGAIQCMDSTITIKHTRFINNIANSGQGGAIYLGNTASSFKSDGNVFIGNKARSGGAIGVNICSTCTDTLLNNVFIDNKSISSGAYGGGAIVVNGSRNYIYNNTFMSDTAVSSGGAIRLQGSGGLVKVANNIFSGNKSGTSTSVDTSLAGSGTFLFSNNIYTGTSPQFRDSTNPAGSDGLWGTADDGLKLRSCSPAVNAGSNAYVVAGEVIDITGSTRLAEGTVDIGAYESNNIGVIAGPATLCVGSTTTYTDTTAGGTWVSSNTATATVSASGVVRALSAGTTTLSYTATSSCGGSITATRFITVERPVAIILGSDTICRGATTVLTDSLTGGTWTSSNTTIATVNSAGLVAAVNAGVDTISYSFANACGTTTARKRILVQRPVSPVAGTDTICRGTVHVYTDSASGGAWSTSNTTVATVGSTGSLTALAVGRDSVIYTLTNICGTSTTYKVVSVERTPSIIVTPDSICSASSSSYTPVDSVSGGIWRLSNHTVLNLTDSTTGIHNPLTTGIDTLSYTVVNSCGTNTVFRLITVVSNVAGTITGADSVCIGDTIHMHETLTTGVWTSSDTSILTINSSGVITGVHGGTTYINHIITNACGVLTANFLVTVKTAPASASITGGATVCTGGTTTLSATPTGGSWSVTNANASISAAGVVTGNTLGVDTIRYTLTNSCGTGTFTYGITVVTVPVAATITGPDTVCAGDHVTIAASVAGGTWSAVNGNATVLSGVVTGVTPGVDTIKYTISNACGTAGTVFPITVYSTGYCDSATSVASVVGARPEFSLYPNPATNVVTVKLASQGTENVVITMANIVGEKVGEWATVTNKASDLQLNVAPGVYILTATTGNYKFVTRVVVE